MRIHFTALTLYPANALQTANALYTEDGSSDALISFNMGHEDGDVEMGWMLVGAKYDEALAMKEQ